MLKIQNVSKIKGKIVNGCRVLDIEYGGVDRGYIFTMQDTHGLNSDNTGAVSYTHLTLPTTPYV